MIKRGAKIPLWYFADVPTLSAALGAERGQHDNRISSGIASPRRCGRGIALAGAAPRAMISTISAIQRRSDA
jgi:hypothetical protein